MPRRLPLTKKELEPKIKTILDKLIQVFHLQDWKIYYDVSTKVSDCCAEVRKNRSNEYKEATITIYPRSIQEIENLGYKEPLVEVLEHEMLHVVLWDCFMNVEDDIVDHPQFLKAEEVLIERIIRILHERKS